jgi:hypothetical protein
MAAWNLVGVYQCVHRNLMRQLRRVTTKVLLSRKPQKLVAAK